MSDVRETVVLSVFLTLLFCGHLGSKSADQCSLCVFIYVRFDEKAFPLRLSLLSSSCCLFVSIDPRRERIIRVFVDPCQVFTVFSSCTDHTEKN